MAGENFQDNVIYGTDGILRISTAIALSNSTAEHAIVANPTVNRTLSLPDASGTLLLSGSAIQGFGVSTGGNTLGSTGTTVGTIVLAGIGNITLSQSTAAGSLATITISAATQTVQPGVTAIGVSTGGNTAGTTGTTQGTYILAGGNNITLSQSTAAGSLATVTISAANSATVVSGVGVSTGGNTAGSTGTTNGTIVFAGGNNITLSQSTAANAATITISGPNAQTFVGGIAAGTQTGTSGTIVFSNSNNVSFGMSNSSVVTATVENKLTAFVWPQPFHDTNFGISNATLSVQKVYLPMHHTATRMMVIMHMSGASNSSGALTWSAAVYTLSGSTASLASSGSVQISWTSGSQTTASSIYGGQSGTQYRTLAINLTMTPGDYLFAYHFKTTNAGSWSIFGKQAVSIANALDANQTNYWLDATSVSSFTTAFPASINVTDTNYGRTGAAALRQPGFLLIGTF